MIKHADQAVKQIGLLFGHGCQVRADREEGVGAMLSAKAARDFLLDLSSNFHKYGDVLY